ncbi:hypothetical protein BC939DRAFT_218971 [Gamsiella multidivaricata]|uniref:uncharacterized protein n=1 Tax=Gamsiella multidivaricata TaxID=101098 RepID=UPI0022201474|nr:uncharacterized protein BC939DRAFT_218971 [Gamsiella multidivaricata]KAI7820868.1 hypothetical protein BC939DRAFT_218971 [Gamsiella multidivaricata]
MDKLMRAVNESKSATTLPGGGRWTMMWIVFFAAFLQRHQKCRLLVRVPVLSRILSGLSACACWPDKWDRDAPKGEHVCIDIGEGVFFSFLILSLSWPKVLVDSISTGIVVDSPSTTQHSISSLTGMVSCSMKNDVTSEKVERMTRVKMGG